MKTRFFNANIKLYKTKIKSKNENPYDKHSIEKAIDWCIENGVLEDFLQNHKSEVLRTMTIDMTFERRLELTRRDERMELIQNALKNGGSPEEISRLPEVPLLSKR